ncbi:Aldo/keto reductase family protein [Handroanthus impetiginosus]|uniref:Aldo/keto reductase family protein n=1 Tax=Handroanthus impetiginosus TaxID=429701 RepID=A0A2G9GVV7_9LAMI|nr:Aldo/keto reductase family protein [Handroanthus impetiginosus]
MSGAIGGPLVNPRIPGEGQNVPAIGMGMRPGLTNLDPSSIKSAILQAIRLGYRHFQITMSNSSEQQALKEAIVKALEGGLVKSRDELFITCRIQHHDDAGFDDAVSQDLKKFLEKMQLEYVDLCLVKWQDSDELKRADNWAAMEECRKLGLTKSIGVCDFSYEMLKNMLENGKIPPAVNQLEMQRLLREKELREFCFANKISIIASSITIGEGQDLDLTRFELEGLKNIEKDGQKTADQVVWRWAYEQGVALLLESFSQGHMQEILNTLEWN